MRAEERPSHTAPMATPARISLSGSTSPALPRPTAVTTNMVTAAPMMAASEKAKGDCHPHQPRAMAAAKLAPTLMPKTPVSANGLRVIICRTAPARAKAQPAHTATRVRGSHLSHTIEEAIPGCPRRAANTSLKGMLRAPNASDSATPIPRMAMPATTSQPRRWALPLPAYTPCSITNTTQIPSYAHVSLARPNLG